MASPSSTSHVVVVGAGIVGASIAFHLARRGVQVTILEAGEPAQGASWVSFAWINGRDKNPRHYHDLNRRSLDMWSRFARRLGDGVGLTWGGELRWAASPEGGRELSARVRELQSWGYPIRLLEPQEMRAMEPAFDFGPIAAASYTEVDGHVDAPAVVQACLARAQELGATLRTQTSLAGLEMAGGRDLRRVAAALTESVAIPCDAVVLAAGPDTPALAALAGLEVPLGYSFGATLLAGPLPPQMRTAAVVHSYPDHPPGERRPQMAFRQLDDGTLMIHGGLHGGSQDRSLGQDEDEAAQVMAVARGLLPALDNAPLLEVRRGRRPLPADGHPILGFTRAVPNLYLATMHSGVTLAALVGELAALEIVDGARVDLLEPFRLERAGL